VNKDVFATAEGREVRLLPVAQVLLMGLRSAVVKEFTERGEPVDVPTYTVTSVTGETETHPLNELLLDNSPNQDENTKNKKAWAVYKDCQARIELEYNARLSRICLVYGVKYDQAEYEKNLWANKQGLFGVEIPTTEPDRLVHYLSTEVLKTPTDLYEAVLRVVDLSMDHAVGEEAVQASVDSFRNSLRSTRGSESDTADATAGEVQQLALLPPLDGSTDGKGVGTDAKPVLASKRRRSSVHDGAGPS
jgi:hypothetical protein